MFVKSIIASALSHKQRYVFERNVKRSGCTKLLRAPYTLPRFMSVCSTVYFFYKIGEEIELLIENVRMHAYLYDTSYE